MRPKEPAEAFREASYKVCYIRIRLMIVAMNHRCAGTSWRQLLMVLNEVERDQVIAIREQLASASRGYVLLLSRQNLQLSA